VFVYHLAGLVVHSEIAFPGAIEATAALGAAEVTIARGAVPQRLEGAAATGLTWSMTEDDFLLRVPDVARFLISRGRSISVELEGGAIEDATIFLAGTAFGILLHQRKHIVLHASAVKVDGGAALFCGPSGAGKSTLAAALAQQGYPFVTDDFCVVALDAAGAPNVHPDGRRLKLWAQAIDKLDLTAGRGACVRNKLEKYYVEPPDAANDSLPLRAVYVLQDARPRLDVSVTRPNVVDAALALGRNAFRPQLIRRMGQNALYFRAAAAIANAAGVFTLARPLDFALMPEVIARLEAHWRDVRAAEPAA